MIGINKVRVRLHRCGGNVRSKDDSDEVDQKMLVWMMTTMRLIKDQFDQNIMRRMRKESGS